MPLSAAIARPGVVVGGLVTLVHHSVPYRVHDSGILPEDDTAEVLNHVDLRQCLHPLVSSCPRNYATVFDALLEDRGDQMVLGDFNTHHPSWFSRTRDDRAAARREALSPKLCDLSSQREREISAALKTLSTLPSSCWTGTSSASSARKRNTSGDPFWNPLTALSIANATGLYCASSEARGRIPPPNISMTFEGKTHSSLKAIARAFNRQFTACSAQQDHAIRRLMRNLHLNRVNPLYRPFDERGVTPSVAEAIRKAGSSTTQGPDGLTMLHLRHLRTHDLAFLTEIFNLSVAGLTSRQSGRALS